MIRATLGSLVLAILVPQDPAAKPPAPAELKKLVAQYVAAAPTDRAPILARIREADTLPRADLKTWVARIWAELQKRPRAGKDDPHTLHLPGLGLKYSIVGTPKAGAPIVIYLHGGGDDQAANEGAWGRAKGAATGLGFPLYAVPRVFEDTVVGWWEESAFLTLAGLMGELKRTYQVDPNRIYLGGYSMGSWGTAVTGAVLADRLAGAFAMAGGGHPRAPMENWRNTPYILHVGDQDTTAGRLRTAREQRDMLVKLREADSEGYPHAYKEWPGIGHQLPGQAHTEVGAWLKEKVRNPYPKRLAWRPFHARFLLFGWLGCDRVGVGVITARIEKGNRVVVDGAPDARLTVFLNDQLVDLKKEVTVVWNGAEAFRGILDYSLSALCETLVEKEDLEQYFPARVELRKS